MSLKQRWRYFTFSWPGEFHPLKILAIKTAEVEEQECALGRRPLGGRGAHHSSDNPCGEPANWLQVMGNLVHHPASHQHQIVPKEQGSDVLMQNINNINGWETWELKMPL